MNEFAKPGLANDQFPPVSATDNGKVLTVADGKWVVGNAVPAGGGGVLVVTDTDGTLDKTYAEIAAVDFAVVIEESDIATTVVPVDEYGESNGEYHVHTRGSKTYSTDSASGYPILGGGK